MGDRCHLTITFRCKDQAKVRNALGLDPVPDDDRAAAETLELDEANYGLTEARYKLAAMEVPFYGSHSSGREYPGFAFAAAGGEMQEIVELDTGGTVVGVTEDGPVQADVEAAREYFRVLKLAQRAIEAPCSSSKTT